MLPRSLWMYLYLCCSCLFTCLTPRVFKILLTAIERSLNFVLCRLSSFGEGSWYQSNAHGFVDGLHTWTPWHHSRPIHQVPVSSYSNDLFYTACFAHPSPRILLGLLVLIWPVSYNRCPCLCYSCTHPSPVVPYLRQTTWRLISTSSFK